MANQGWKNRITKITGRLRPGTTAKPAKLSVELKQGAIKPLGTPIDARLKRAGNKLKNSIDGVNRPKTLGEPEKKELDERAGIKNRPQTVPGGPAMKPNRLESGRNREEETPNEQEELNEEEPNQAMPMGQGGPQEPEMPEPPEPEDDGGDEGDSPNEEGDPNIKKAVANRAIDYLKKTAKKLVSKEAKTAIVAFLLEYWWAILIGIIVIILGFLLFNYLMGTAGQSPSSTGQSATQVYDPAKDRPSLQAVLQLSGDKGAQQLASGLLVAGLQSELTEMRSDPGLATRPDKAEITAKIDIILGDIQTYGTAKDSKTGKKIIDGVKELWEMFGTLPSIGDAGSPLPKGSVAGYTNNLHDGTPMNPCKSGKCSGHSTFYQYNRNTCDAVDLKAKNGTPVYAAFGGKIMKKGDDGKGHQVVFIQNDQKYLAVYAHISGFNGKVNDIVKTGQQIGQVNMGHLHFELAKDGKCVTSTAQDITSSKTDKKAPGYYLWQRMAKVLNNAV